ncbi:MAG: S1C family serine protease [Opitutales bacterium]
MPRYTFLLLFFCLFAGPLQAFHALDLKEGGSLQGTLAWERPDKYYIDLGFDVIEVPKDAVAEIREIDEETGTTQTGAPADRLYRLGEDRRDRPIRDWVEELGEAVTLVQTPTGMGSGFVIHPDGYVVTNNHVVAGEHRISITVFKNTGRELTRETYNRVRIVAISSTLDLALLKIDAEDEGPFETVALAPPERKLREGQSVFAIGSPMGLDRTVSEGIISVTNRVINGLLYIQTTTQISPGNSGGPLFNLQGEVVGVTNMKIAAAGAEGLGFAISSRTLRSFLENRDAYAFDPRNPNSGFRYLSPPALESAEKEEEEEKKKKKKKKEEEDGSVENGN